MNEEKDLFLVDSHCHLNMEEFQNQIPEVLENAKKNGVLYCLSINTKLEETKNVQDIADLYDNVFSSVGVHPHYAESHNLLTLKDDLKAALRHKKTIALGETGLDYYYNLSDKTSQKKSFKMHIEVGIEENVPIIIHTRDADEDTIDILKSYDKKSMGVFHCFSGNKELAKAALNLGFYISFSGIITFKKAVELQEIVKYVPIERILVETDSPYLAPIPFRGKRNEPAYTRYVAEQVASLKDISLQTVAKETTKNFCHLFNLNF
ncbi:MAG: TatD family hydrolase [Proteobacteria bacterium]|nr:TatD family hydrolase [Pseudomonadota bacterium]